MSETEGQAAGLTGEKSPTDKLEEPKVTGSLTPGAENPESEEIKTEINPNTE